MNGEVKSFNPEEITSPRLVYMKRGDQGYGFNLHGEKGVQGQTISAVDKGSPAEVGGLREGDRVIEVNGVNVEMKKHGEVVGLIKQNANETRLLVIDSITDKYLKEKQRPITEDMANLKTVYEAPQPTQDQQPTPEAPEQVELEVKQSVSDETQVEVDATPTQNGDEPGAGQCEEPEVVQPPSQPEPEPTPEVQQDDSPKDAIDQINNVLEQEEKQPVHVAAPDPEPTPEPAVLEKEVTQSVPVAAPNPEPDIFRNIDPASAKPTKKRNKKEGMGWEEKKKWFDGL